MRRKPIGQTTEELRARLGDEDCPSDYGVCDSPEQVTDRWPRIIVDRRPFVIAFTPFLRADQPEQGGWRWHKWGEYIGTQEPTHEYLYDEPHIDKVYTFHIYEVNT